jgi:hypothetical protein
LDLFDRLYIKWATVALRKQMDSPSRERWDEIVLFLLMSKDPVRIARYRRLEAEGPDSLGGDAYDLWEKMPAYMSNRADGCAGIKTQSELTAYAEAHQDTMSQLMERRGLLELYNTIIAQQEEIERERRTRARRGQTGIIIMGCAGMGAILIMMLVVFIIIALKMAG